ncbi:Polycomb protein EZH2, partial [Phytophthora megakarya]
TAKVASVCGVHHITTWSLHNIVFDYSYKRGVDPDWSRRRHALMDTIMVTLASDLARRTI